MWQKGHKLQGKYRIEEKLGEGGFGITYKAKHIELDGWVVIKTPNARLKEDTEYLKFVQRFKKEAKTLYKLGQERHPHIVRVNDLFVEGDLPCLVMDFLEGENLYQRVQTSGALSEEEVVGYIRQIGSALSLVHRYGLVHRDAHPGNIMLPRPEEAILIDFGLVGEIFPTTMSSKAMGNPAFASNEQLRGTGREPTVDIYTLAAYCYYGVTGRLPQFNENEELILPKQINPHISHSLNQAISRVMALLPKNRPQTMAEWLELLESIPSTIPSVAPVQSNNIPIQPSKEIGEKTKTVSIEQSQSLASKIKTNVVELWQALTSKTQTIVVKLWQGLTSQGATILVGLKQLLFAQNKVIVEDPQELLAGIILLEGFAVFGFVSGTVEVVWESFFGHSYLPFIAVVMLFINLVIFFCCSKDNNFFIILELLEFEIFSLLGLESFAAIFLLSFQDLFHNPNYARLWMPPDFLGIWAVETNSEFTTLLLTLFPVVWVVELVLSSRMKWINKESIMPYMLCVIFFSMSWGVVFAVIGAIEGAAAGIAKGAAVGALAIAKWTVLRTIEVAFLGALFGVLIGIIIGSVLGPVFMTKKLLTYLVTPIVGLGLGWLVSLGF